MHGDRGADRRLDVYALVIACQGVYRLTDTARYFGLSVEVVRRIWNSDIEVDEVEPPNIWGCRPTKAMARSDALILKRRGLNAEQIAEILDTCPSWVRGLLADA